MASAAIGRRRRKRRWLHATALLFGPLLVAACAAYLYYSGGRYVATENAYIKADKVMIGAEVSGAITEVAVTTNQSVQRGQILFSIDDRPYRIALAEAEAHLANVRAEIAGLKAQYHQKQEELELARSNLAFARSEYDRQSKLIANQAVSRSKFDATRRDFDVARLGIKVIEQELAQIRAELAGDADIATETHPKFREAEAKRDRAALDLENTVVRAPFAGIASNVPNPGEQVSGNGPLSAPVMSIVAAEGIWIEANFKETELTHIHVGQSAKVRVDTYPDHALQGRVESISQATGAEFSVIPPQNATGNWVKVVQRVPVRISVDTEEGGPVLRAGMSTEVEIDTERRRALPEVLESVLAWVGLERQAMAAAPAD